GNVLTKKIFSFASGLSLSDTQTGLRGIPYAFMKHLMNVSGERFEYEMNMLLECKVKNVQIEEVNIETIYIEQNSSSHFNPVLDSVKIYTVFLKYTFSSLTSFGLDILLFTIDRKSTRLNSSHVSISYAVFCLKKKKNTQNNNNSNQNKKTHD